jgi:2'-5' RNA ligase
MDKVLTLLVKDRYVGGLLRFMQKNLTDSPISSPPHITIRGPYADNISRITVKKIEEVLRNMPVTILSGIQYFYVDDDNLVVFINVINDGLRKITMKKDFPMSKYGFNPHITLCKTANVEKVNRIMGIFNKKNFELKLESDQFELRSIEVGKLNKEFDFLSYADEDELIDKSSLFRDIILLTREAAVDAGNETFSTVTGKE